MGIFSLVTVVMLMASSILPEDVINKYVPPPNLQPTIASQDGTVFFVDGVEVLYTDSIIETDEVFTESDDTLIEQFLDEVDIGFSEKFGLEIQTVLFDSDQNQVKSSDIIVIPQLSVTDEEGRLLDLGTIQTAFAGISRDLESTVEIWGTVKFYLDDDIIATKNIWASDSQVKVVDLAIVNTLKFEQPDATDSVKIKALQSRLNIIVTDIASFESEIIQYKAFACSNCNGRDTEVRIREDKINVLDVERTALKAEIKQLDLISSQRIPVAPAFSDRKPTFTFTLSDEGRDWVDGSEHTYRVVLSELVAVISSPQDVKQFHFKGEHIGYKLTVKVDGSKKTIFDRTGSAISIFKSDSSFSVTSPTYSYSYNTCCGGANITPSPQLPVSFTVTDKLTGTVLGVIDNTSFSQNTVTGISQCGGYPVQRCGSQVVSSPSWSNPVIDGVPRGTVILITTSDGQVFEITTPNAQHNYFVACDSTHCTSNFGYTT